jgi:hypothetical protein
MSLIRALIAWFVVFWLLLLLTSMLGAWDRRHSSDVGSTPSS